MKIVIDKGIPLAEVAFTPFGEISLLPSSEIIPASVRDADVLIVRSETIVDRSLLHGSKVKFVGSATIGTDHLDLDYLRSAGIALANAPGCNANAVKEYVVAALLHLAVHRGVVLKGRSIGIIGVGNVGSKVAVAAKALAMTVLRNDPPLARLGGEGEFVSLAECLSADFISLHVPLTKSGPDPTFHLLGREQFQTVRPGAVLLNTSRGGVVETGAVKEAITSGRFGATVLDVWENEPTPDPALIENATLATAHIAGYSYEGKTNATRMIRDALCRHLGVPVPFGPVDVSVERGLSGEHSGNKTLIEIDFRKFAAAGSLNESEMEILHTIVRQAYDIAYDDRLLRGIRRQPIDQRAAFFRGLRSQYRKRREFSTFDVLLPHPNELLETKLSTLGFAVLSTAEAPSSSPA